MKLTQKILIAIAFMTLAKGLIAAEPATDVTIKPGAYWTMDKIIDGVFQDETGMHHAKVPELSGQKDKKTGEILPDFVPVTEPGLKGNAVSFEQKQQGFFNVTAPKQFDFKNGMTVSAWVKIKSINSIANILSCAEDVPNPKGGWILFCTYGKAVFKAVDQSGAFIGVASPANSVAPDAWVHVAGVVDASKIRLYLNGVEVGSKPFAGPVKLADTALVIGNHATIAGWRHFQCPAFGGLMDEVKIFAKPLSATEIQIESEQALSSK
jgi:hypothetical protein